MNFTIGSDPEFILIDEKNNFKSAIGIIKGTRKKRLKINNLDFYYDNVLAEFTVKPSSNKKDFLSNLKNSINICEEIIKPLRLSSHTSAEFSSEELLHPDARKSGCAVEHCAYSLEVISSKKIEKLFKKNNLRTAGGHVHLGFSQVQSHDFCIMLVRMLDLFLGFVSLFLDNSPGCVERRKIYGAPGRYRQPSYGVEYRTLSNFWILDPELTEIVYDLCEFSIEFTNQKKYENFWKVDYDKLNSDSFWNEGGDPSSCHQCYGYNLNRFKKLFFMGKEELANECLEIKDIVDFYLPKELKNKINSKFIIF